MTKSNPVLTVVIVAGDQRNRYIWPMESILHQDIIDKMEVLVMDCSAAGSSAFPLSDHPSVRLVRRSERTLLDQARTDGVHLARAPIVAFLTEHSYAMAGWAEALVNAHEGPWAAVGGEIYNGNSSEGFSDPVYLMGHLRWLPPVPRGEAEMLPAHDTSYKRDILLSYGESLHGLLLAEPIFHRKLRLDGHSLYLEPDAKSIHTYTATLETLGVFFAWSRCYGYIRGQVFGWQKLQRLLFFLSFPIRPWGRLTRIFQYLAREKPQRLWSFLTGLPIIALAQYIAVLGETVGLVFGIGQAERRFSDSHMRGLRRVALKSPKE
jgi:hypothetical protein